MRSFAETAATGKDHFTVLAVHSRSHRDERAFAQQNCLRLKFRAFFTSGDKSGCVKTWLPDFDATPRHVRQPNTTFMCMHLFVSLHACLLLLGSAVVFTQQVAVFHSGFHFSAIVMRRLAYSMGSRSWGHRKFSSVRDALHSRAPILPHEQIHRPLITDHPAKDVKEWPVMARLLSRVCTFVRNFVSPQLHWPVTFTERNSSHLIFLKYDVSNPVTNRM